jgi:Na+-transporting NADH:ubiquinone oxidoreductase subunit F
VSEPGLVTQVGLGIGLFTAIVLILVFVILLARSRLVASGSVDVLVNGERHLKLPVGGKLMQGLAEEGILVASACGGGGTCGQCRVQVLEGGGAILPTETSLISKREAADHERLSCQVAVKQDMKIQVPDEVFGVKKYECTVVSNRNVASFIKELVLKLPEGEEMDFQAGGYIQIECPPHHLKYKDFDIDEEFHEEWDRYNLWRYESDVKEGTYRAYSMANFPLEKGLVKLNVRIATPPPGASDKIPPGILSSYIFGLKPGDKALTHFRPVEAHPFAPQDELLVRRTLLARVVLQRRVRRTRRSERELRMAPGAVRARGRRQLDRLHGFHPPGTAR